MYGRKVGRRRIETLAIALVVKGRMFSLLSSCARAYVRCYMCCKNTYIYLCAVMRTPPFSGRTDLKQNWLATPNWFDLSSENVGQLTWAFSKQ